MPGDPLTALANAQRSLAAHPLLRKRNSLQLPLRHQAHRRHLKVSEKIFSGGLRSSSGAFGRHRVCLGTACHVKGGRQMLDVLERRLGIHPGETTPDGEYDLERVACLGCCALAPVIVMNNRTHGQMSVLKLQEKLSDDEHRQSTP
jgi:hypothetical protein